MECMCTRMERRFDLRSVPGDKWNIHGALNASRARELQLLLLFYFAFNAKFINNHFARLSGNVSNAAANRYPVESSCVRVWEGECDLSVLTVLFIVVSFLRHSANKLVYLWDADSADALYKPNGKILKERGVHSFACVCFYFCDLFFILDFVSYCSLCIVL